MTLIQTLKNKDNPDVVERDGPFICTRSDAWLGTGYYFWDTHIELGHWWGLHCYGDDNYMICGADCIFDENCWDLHANGDHRKEFIEIYNELVKSISSKDKLYVAHIINFFKAKKQFKYNSIRALGVNSLNSNFVDRYLIFQMGFPKSKAYLDLIPPVQVCLINKTALSLRNYKLVYPEFYSEIYA